MASIEIKSPIPSETLQNGSMTIQGIVRIPLGEYKPDKYQIHVTPIDEKDTAGNSPLFFEIGTLSTDFIRGTEFYAKSFSYIIPSRKTYKQINVDLFCDSVFKAIAHDSVIFKKKRKKKEATNYDAEL